MIKICLILRSHFEELELYLYSLVSASLIFMFVIYVWIFMSTNDPIIVESQMFLVLINNYGRIT